MPFWASLVAQLVKNLLAMWETWVWALGWEDLLEKGKAMHSSVVAWTIPWTTVHGVAKSQTWLSDFHFPTEHWVEFLELDSIQFVLSLRVVTSIKASFWLSDERRGTLSLSVIYFIYSITSVHVAISVSQFIPPTALPHLISIAFFSTSAWQIKSSIPFF